MIYTLRDKLTVFYYKTSDERQNHVLVGDIDEVPVVALLIGLYCHLNKPEWMMIIHNFRTVWVQQNNASRQFTGGGGGGLILLSRHLYSFNNSFVNEWNFPKSNIFRAMLHIPALRYFDVSVIHPQGFHWVKFVIIPRCFMKQKYLWSIAIQPAVGCSDFWANKRCLADQR